MFGGVKIKNSELKRGDFIKIIRSELTSPLRYFNNLYDAIKWASNPNTPFSNSKFLSLDQDIIVLFLYYHEEIDPETKENFEFFECLFEDKIIWFYTYNHFKAYNIEKI